MLQRKGLTPMQIQVPPLQPTFPSFGVRHVQLKLLVRARAMKLQLFISVLVAVLIVLVLVNYFGWHHEAIAISR